MMNLNKDTIEYATFPTAESEFLKAMDAHRQAMSHSLRLKWAN